MFDFGRTIVLYRVFISAIQHILSIQLYCIGNITGNFIVQKAHRIKDLFLLFYAFAGMFTLGM